MLDGSKIAVLQPGIELGFILATPDVGSNVSNPYYFQQEKKPQIQNADADQDKEPNVST